MEKKVVHDDSMRDSAQKYNIVESTKKNLDNLGDNKRLIIRRFSHFMVLHQPLQKSHTAQKWGFRSRHHAI